MKLLKIIIGAVLFAACVYLATVNMHIVDLFFPEVPVSGWPQVGPVQAPLFLVVLASLLLGVLFTGLLTLLEQVRLRTVARRARKERDRATAALQPTARERDAAVAERDALRAELEGLRTETETLRAESDQARADLAQVRADLEATAAERDALRAEAERLRGANEAHTPSSTAEPAPAAAHAMIEGEEAS